MENELVTVIIPARNEEHFIRPCLDSVLSQDYKDIQVVVVDGDSEDTTREVVSGYAEADPRVELLVNPRRSIPTSLNLGLGAARGRYLVRVDAHSTVPEGYVGDAVSRLESGRWGGVGGRKDGVGVTPEGRAIAAALGSPFGVGNSIYHHGVRAQEVDHIPFGAYPIALAREMGGWDERIEANEDYEFDYRLRQAGHRLLFDPELRIDWHCRQSLSDLWRQYRRYGRGKAVVVALHPRSLSPRHVLPPGFVLVLGAASMIGLRRPAVAVAILSPYLVALTIASAATGKRVPDRTARAYVPLTFPVMHVAYGCGFLEGLAGAANKSMRAPVAAPTGGQA
jgi:succinoglycan biosynthesis protein ExoA